MAEGASEGATEEGASEAAAAGAADTSAEGAIGSSKFKRQNCQGAPPGWLVKSPLRAKCTAADRTAMSWTELPWAPCGNAWHAAPAPWAASAWDPGSAEALLTKKAHRMRLDPSFCEVQPARALYRGGVNNGGCIYESEKVRSKPFSSCRWVASCKLRRATCNRQPSQTARRTSHVASLCPGLWTDHRQRRRRLHVARRTSHHCAQGYGLGCRSACESASRNPRAVGQSQAAARRLQLAASRPGMC